MNFKINNYQNCFATLSDINGIPEENAEVKKRLYKEWFDKTTNDIVLLIESRGVAISQYTPLLNDIKKYLNQIMFVNSTTNIIKKLITCYDDNKKATLLNCDVGIYGFVKVNDEILEKMI